MFYLKVEDEYYYSEEGKKELLQKYNLKNYDLIFAKDKETILKSFEDGSIVNKVFFAPYLPEKLNPVFEGIFDLIRVENYAGLLTKKQQEEGIKQVDILRDKLGANIYMPQNTFKDYIIEKKSENFKNLMNNLKIINMRADFGLPTKGFFLTGVPGTGKTFFAKCVAGELNRMLVELNLSFFINADDTFGLLNKFFSFFKYNEGEYVLLIDEIEKMFNDSPKAKQVLGYLLTTLNEFHDKSRGNKADVLFIATANNVSDLAQKNPELFRKGRFDLSIYLTNPNKEKASETFEFYVGFYNKIFQKQSIPMILHNLKTNKYTMPQQTRIEMIFDELKNNTKVMNIIENAEYKDNKDEFFELIKDNEIIKQAIELIKTKFSFKINIIEIVSLSFAKYREEMNFDRSLFPYVPAEIQAMTSELFNEFYFNKDEVNISSFIELNKPLVISMSSAILDMNGATTSFIKL